MSSMICFILFICRRLLLELNSIYPHLNDPIITLYLCFSLATVLPINIIIARRSIYSIRMDVVTHRTALDHTTTTYNCKHSSSPAISTPTILLLFVMELTVV